MAVRGPHDRQPGVMATALITTPATLDEMLALLLDRAGGVTHPLEVAATLEVNGVNDGRARLLGFDSVFALSDHLYAQLAQTSGRDEAPAAAAPGITRAAAFRALIKGPLFALPGLSVLAIVPAGPTSREALLLAVSLIWSWAFGQATAYRGYLDMAWGTHRRALLRAVVGHLSVLAAACTALAVAGQVRPSVAVAAALQGGYILAANAIMVLGRELLLFAVLLPGAAAGMARLLADDAAGPQPWHVAVGASCLTVPIVAALVLTRGRPTATERTPGIQAVPYGLHGLATALLVLWLPAHGANGAAFLGAVVPLVLSLGLVELTLLHLQADRRRQAVTSLTMAAFSHGIRERLGILFAVYSLGLAAALVLTNGLLLVTGTIDGAASEALARTDVAMLALGAALFFSSVALAHFGVVQATVALAVGLAVLTAVDVLLPDTTVLATFTVVCAALALVLGRVANERVANPPNLL